MRSATYKLARSVVACSSALIVSLAAVCHAATDTTSTVTGTGGSSSTRVLAQWNSLFSQQTKISVEFAPANSDVGIREAIARNVDFGCTEIPLAGDELAKNNLVQFPLLIGGVVLIVNIPGVEPGALRLNSTIASKLFLGELKLWNDDEIRALNPGLNLPKLPIKLIVRETSASTTLALTTFLAATDRTWAARIGASKLPDWPAPVTRASTVKAMGEKVQATPGAIGYINVDEAYRQKLAYTQLRNRAGQYVKPTHEAILAATTVAGLGKTGDQIPTLINVDGAASWPIVEVTYVLVDRKPRDLARARSTLKFFFWAFLQGDRMAAETGFVPLPTSTQARVVGRFRDIVTPDNTSVDFLR
jgi:phosphate transport system substrate-binding protein